MTLPSSPSAGTTAPELSVVIPVYNEAAILREAVLDLHGQLAAAGVEHELILAENGSRDGTLALARTLMAEVPGLRCFHYPEPNYGGALREAIARARGRFVVCEEIDIGAVEFHLRALTLLRAGEADMVVGSKAMRGADDRRPLVRRVATRAYNGLLRVTLGFRGTDTHGLKAFVRAAVAPVAEACVVEHDVFASELVIRAQRSGLRVVEVPVRIAEKRAPSIDLRKRIPRVLRNVGRLWVAIHVVGDRRPAGGTSSLRATIQEEVADLGPHGVPPAARTDPPQPPADRRAGEGDGG
jgi:glycosyltransferase involved in cell wall biosynthesis